MFLATVAFTALVGVLWEVCEYAIDGLSGKNMQRFNNSVTNEPFVGRKALRDTMIDLMMDTLGGVLAGLYFAFTNIKGIPLYKFLELKYVKSDSSITYSEDHVLNEQLKQAQNEKRALKIVAKNEKRKAKIDRDRSKRAYKQEKLQLSKEHKISKKQDKLDNKKIKQTNKKIKKQDKQSKTDTPNNENVDK